MAGIGSSSISFKGLKAAYVAGGDTSASGNSSLNDNKTANEENKFTPSVKAENIANDLALSCQLGFPSWSSLTFINVSILAIVVSSSKNSAKLSNPNSSLSKE